MPELTAQWSTVIPRMTYKKIFKITISGKCSKLRFGIRKKSYSFSSNAALRGVIVPRPFPAGTQASEFLGSS